MKSFLAILFIGISSSLSHASCQLPAGQKITIGCTYKCDFFTRNRLKLVGAKLGYKLDFIDLSEQQNVSGLLSQLDSVLIPGGADINPKFYFPIGLFYFKLLIIALCKLILLMGVLCSNPPLSLYVISVW